ncbi:MAG TPA: hypothetical protein VF042_07400 [Gemmatimonadaceae bacterium]
MKALIVAGALAITSASADAQFDHGRWMIDQRTGSSLYIELRWPDNSDWHHVIDVTELSGITIKDVESDSKKVTFFIDEDAGRIEFEGTVGNGDGRGEFHFTPNRAFESKLRAVGIVGLREISDWDLMNLAWGRFSEKSARRFIALGLGPLDRDAMMDLAVQHVTPDFVRDLQVLGVKGLDNVHIVVEARMFGVTPTLVRALNHAGFRGLTVSEILDLRMKGVARPMA